MSTDVRACPECGQPQIWCDTALCSSPLLPRGHWDHGDSNRGPDGDPLCMLLGDRNRTPGAPPDTPFTRHPEMFDPSPWKPRLRTYAEARSAAIAAGWRCLYCGTRIQSGQKWATDVNTGKPVCESCYDNIPHIDLGKGVPFS